MIKKYLFTFIVICFRMNHKAQKRITGLLYHFKKSAVNSAGTDFEAAYTSMENNLHYIYFSTPKRSYTSDFSWAWWYEFLEAPIEIGVSRKFDHYIAGNFSDNNNKIYVNENGTDYTITWTNGYYDSTDLTSHLSTTLNDALSDTVSVSFDDNTNKFTIADTINSARKLLGFNETDGSPSLTTQTSDVAVDLNQCENIFITIKQDDNRNIEGIDFFNCSLIVNGVSNFGDILRYVNVDNFTQTLKLKSTKTLNVSFHDASNNTINLNSEYQIILRKV